MKQYIYRAFNCVNKPEFVIVQAKTRKEADKKFEALSEQNQHVEDTFTTYSQKELKFNKDGIVLLNSTRW